MTRYLRRTTKPKVRIVSVKTDRVYTDIQAIGPITTGSRVTIEYNALDFKTVPEKRQYRYRIKGDDGDWRNPTKETVFDDAFKKPGTYIFEVQAIDRDLNYSESVSVTLKVIPPFYLQASFLIPTVGGGMILVAVLIFVSIGYVRRRQQLKTAQRQLITSEKKYRLLADNVSDTIWTMDVNAKFTYLSPSLERLAGYTQEEAAHLTLADILTPSSLQIARESIQRRLAGGVPEETILLELEIVRKDGSTFWSEISSTLVRDTQGNITGFLGVTRDISERIKAREALKESEERYRSIFENATMGIFRTTPQGQVLTTNPAGAHILGYASVQEVIDEITNLAEQVYFDPDERQMVLQLIREKGEATVEVRLRRKDGTPLMAKLNLWLVKDEEGNLRFLEGFIEDITERKQTEEKLKLYHRIFMASSDGVTITDPNGNLIDFNPTVQQQMGCSAEEVQDIHFDIFTVEEDLEAIHQALEETGSFRRETTIQAKDGSLAYIDMLIFPVHNDDGELVCYVGMGRDISEMKQAHDALEEAYQNLRDTQAKLVQSEKMASLGRLVAGVAHEFNNPISAVQSSNKTLGLGVRKLEAICSKAQDSPCRALPEFNQLLTAIKRCQQVVEEGTERVATIVQRMKAFARLDEAELQLADIHRCIEDTLRILPRGWEEHINLVRSYGQLTDIFCYPAGVNQVLYNVLVNAVESIEGEGEIRIQTRMEEDFAVIEIHDTGVGIPADVKEHMFDPGFTTKSRGVGTGLGLAICYQIMQEHNGRIKVESEVGKGSMFTIILPLDLKNRITSPK